MSDDFGDFDEDDALDHEPADPEQSARKIHDLRHREGYEDAEWDDLDDEERRVLIVVVTAFLAWLRRQGAHP